MSMCASVNLSLNGQLAFEAIVTELGTALAQAGMEFQPGPNGRVLQGKTEVGQVVRWQPPEEILMEWHGADWLPAEVTTLEFRFQPQTDGTQVLIEHRGWETLIGDQGNELAGWFASEIAAPLLIASSPRRFGDWLTDRRA